jgi:hypothetical protein
MDKYGLPMKGDTLFSVLYRIEQKLDQILLHQYKGEEEATQTLKQSQASLQQTLDSNKGGSIMAKAKAPLDDLTAQVTATVGTEQSAITLIQGLAAALTAAAGDPAKIAAIVAQLNTSAAALAAAVAANPAPVAPPAP